MDRRRAPRGPKTCSPGRKQEHLWSLQPLTKPAVPRARIAVGADADRRLRSREAERQNLTPSPEADRATLIRRLTYDLHGLPPTREEIQAFVADQLAGCL